MFRTRLWFALLLAALVGATAAAGPGLLKGKKTDPARIPELVEALKSDADEKRRRTAADELGRADARIAPEVVTALIAALQKDPSPAVRTEAAAAIGQLGAVYPLAGAALEAAASADESAAVRLAAKKALWEYHLSGYRSPKGADGVGAQTVEPPIASPAAPRAARAPVPVYPPVVPLVPQLPERPPVVALLPPVSPPGGPRLARPWLSAEGLFGQRPTPAPAAVLGPPIPNVTAEPPIAKRPAVAIPLYPAAFETPLVPPPTVAVEPPPEPVPSPPDYVPTLPPFVPDLPPIVLPPEPTPVRPAPVPPTIPATLPARPR